MASVKEPYGVPTHDPEQTRRVWSMRIADTRVVLC
jgi:hypothetical protein